MQLSIPREGHARVRVMDVGGREIVRLHDGPLAAGEHTLFWNGSVGGRPAASGVYFVIYEAGGRKAVRRIVLAP